MQRQTADLQAKEQSLEEQRGKISNLLSQLSEKSAILQEKEKALGDMSLKLDQSGRKLAETEGDVGKRPTRSRNSGPRWTRLNNTIAQLNKRISEYVDQVNGLNRMLAEAKQSEQTQTTKAADLQKEISSLRSKLDEISGKLAAAKEKRDGAIPRVSAGRASGQKEKEIDRLRKLAKYRSEFLAKLEQVFQGVADIKVQGDRFVFQSEILFASGRADINEGGKKELDKFVKIYNEMVPKIPKDLDLVILIQGYTDDVPIRSGAVSFQLGIGLGPRYGSCPIPDREGNPAGQSGRIIFWGISPRGPQSDRRSTPPESQD